MAIPKIGKKQVITNNDNQPINFDNNAIKWHPSYKPVWGTCHRGEDGLS